MPKYVLKQLTRYTHPAPLKPQHCPFLPIPISYGKDNHSLRAPCPVQTATLPLFAQSNFIWQRQSGTHSDRRSPPLFNAGKKRIKQIIGSFFILCKSCRSHTPNGPLQYCLPIGCTYRMNQAMSWSIPWLHVDTPRRYNSLPCLRHGPQRFHSDASYLSAPKAQSRAGGYIFLGSIPIDGAPIKLNGAVHITCTILKLVAASAAEAELGALFLNAQEAKVLWLTLAKLGHPQSPTPIHIDNTATVGIVNYTIKRQCSQAMEMRYFCLFYGKTQKYFKFYYQPRQENLGDYPSKRHTANIHQHVRLYYVHTNKSPVILPRALKPSIWQGCAETLGDPYTKNTLLPRIGDPSSPLPVAPSIPSHQMLGQSRIITRITLPHTISRRTPIE